MTRYVFPLYNHEVITLIPAVPPRRDSPSTRVLAIYPPLRRYLGAASARYTSVAVGSRACSCSVACYGVCELQSPSRRFADCQHNSVIAAHLQGKSHATTATQCRSPAAPQDTTDGFPRRRPSPACLRPPECRWSLRPMLLLRILRSCIQSYTSTPSRDSSPAHDETSTARHPSVSLILGFASGRRDSFSMGHMMSAKALSLSTTPTGLLRSKSFHL